MVSDNDLEVQTECKECKGSSFTETIVTEERDGRERMLHRYL